VRTTADWLRIGVATLLLAGGAAGLAFDRAPHGDAAACRSAFKPLLAWNTDVDAVNDKTKTTGDVSPAAAATAKKLRSAAREANDGSTVEAALAAFADDVARVRVAWLSNGTIDSSSYISDVAKLAAACRPLDSRW
jgi:hypothetical protein